MSAACTPKGASRDDLVRHFSHLARALASSSLASLHEQHTTDKPPLRSGAYPLTTWSTKKEGKKENRPRGELRGKELKSKRMKNAEYLHTYIKFHKGRVLTVTTVMQEQRDMQQGRIHSKHQTYTICKSSSRATFSLVHFLGYKGLHASEPSRARKIYYKPKALLEV
jgi:hypothetical protein